MDTSTVPDVAHLARAFALPGELAGVERFGAGHINDSFRVTVGGVTVGGVTVGHAAAGQPPGTAGLSARYLLQRINTAVFPDVAGLMANLERVTAHVASRLRAAGATDVARRCLTLVPSRDGAPFVRTPQGDSWRLFPFLEGTTGVATVQSPEQAFEAARAFGEFQALLADLPPAALRETIPHFHDTPRRFAALERAVAADVHARVAACRAEIDFARHRRPHAQALLALHAAGAIPLRVVHNDAKISNVLFDAGTGRAVCVVDLDTVMPGLSLYDFGDMVRSMSCRAAEDDDDAERVEVDLPLFTAVAAGYLAAAGGFLTAAERGHLVLAGTLLALEQGVRFLTDHLDGDTYYRTARPGQNLARARVQFALVSSLERRAGDLARAIRTG